MPTEINMFAILSSSDLFTREDTLCVSSRGAATVAAGASISRIYSASLS